MDFGTHDAGPKIPSTSAAPPAVHRKSSTTRARPKQNTPSVSVKHLQTPPPADRTLTSFPSLSPSLENSPETTTRSSRRSKVTKDDADRRASIVKKIPTALDGLFDPPSAARDRLSLFADTPKDARDIPGALHQQSDDHIRHAIARNGAVALVRRLACDLAQRDAQATALQQRAEERERLLREILRECGLSKMDIDNRLRELEKGRQLNSAASVSSSRRTSAASRTQSQHADSLSDRLSEAIDDSMSPEDTSPVQNAWAHIGDEAQNTIRVPGKARVTSEDASSIASTDTQNAAQKGWKRLFGYGAAPSKLADETRSMDERTGRKQDLAEALSREDSRTRTERELFEPPPAVLIRSASSTASLQEQLRRTRSHESKADQASQTATKSVASWALRLVAGGAQNNKSTTQDLHPRDRASTIASSKSDDATLQSASTANRAKVRRPESLTSTTGNHKISPDAARLTRQGQALPMSPKSPIGLPVSNLGPVEMDTILPEETRPPTLLPLHNIHGGSEYLTDRFGFIYDQRRKIRQDQALAALSNSEYEPGSAAAENKHLSHALVQKAEEDASSIDSRRTPPQDDSRPRTPLSTEVQEDKKQPKRWQDYLKISNITATELLSHTPSSAPITSVTIAEDSPDVPLAAPHIILAKRGAAPVSGTASAPLATSTVSDNAEIAQPSASGSATPLDGPASSQTDTIKRLLEQLTEVHDANQREKTAKWNEFLRKVRAERKRDGDASSTTDGRGRAASMPEAWLLDGEIIGIAGLGNKGRSGRAKWSEFRHLVLAGIPVAYRAKIWAECSGAASLRIPGYYDDLVNSGDIDPTVVTQIQMDITRTLTDNIFFRNGPGIEKLREVLTAYAKRNPEIGYCQGMNLITACLLLIMPTAEDAFWVLVSMIENILPERYYDSSLLTSRADQAVLRQYVAEILPQLSQHLEELSIELEALTFQWFLSVFTDCLSAEALFRVWDVILCFNDGATFLFQVALALLSLNEKQLVACETSAEVYAYINHGVTDHAITIDGLVRASDGLRTRVRREDVVKRRAEAVRRELDLTSEREREREVDRERDRTRKGKGRHNSTASDSMSVATNDANQIAPRDATRSSSFRSGRASIHGSSTPASRDESPEDLYGDLTVRSPMPIDEEALMQGS